MNPFDQVNQAMKDRDDKFTKREFMAMHFMARIISRAQLNEIVDSKNVIQLCQLAIKAADVLLQELGKPRGK